MLKFQSGTTLFKHCRLPRKVMACVPPCSTCPHKVWLRSDENCRSRILEFPAPYGPVLTNISNCHKILIVGQKLADRQKIKLLTHSPMATLFIRKFGSNLIKSVGGVTLCEFFAPIWSHVNEKEKKS